MKIKKIDWRDLVYYGIKLEWMMTIIVEAWCIQSWLKDPVTQLGEIEVLIIYKKNLVFAFAFFNRLLHPIKWNKNWTI